MQKYVKKGSQSEVHDEYLGRYYPTNILSFDQLR